MLDKKDYVRRALLDCAVASGPTIFQADGLTRTIQLSPGLSATARTELVHHRTALRILLHVPIQLPVCHSGDGRRSRIHHLSDHGNAQRVVHRIRHGSARERFADRSHRRENGDADRRRGHHHHQSYFRIRLVRGHVHYLRGDLADEWLRAVVRCAGDDQDECGVVSPHRARNVRRHFRIHDSARAIWNQQPGASDSRWIYDRHVGDREK